MGDVSAVPEMSPDPRVHVFRRSFDGMDIAAYAIVSKRYVVICDTLLCPADMASLMEALDDDLRGRQLLVINSHADWDHVWGNCYFSSAAAIIAHEHCLNRMLSTEAQRQLAQEQQRNPLFSDVVLTPPTITFNQRLVIQGGDLRIELFSAPGHCADHIAAWLPELRLLLAFDAVELPLPSLENAAAVPAMLLTLEYFLRLQPQYVLCSHSPTTGSAIVQQNLAYLHTIEERSRRLLETYSPTSTELAHAPQLIGYTFDDVMRESTIAGSTIDRLFYSQAHHDNVRYMLQWLMNERSC